MAQRNNPGNPRHHTPYGLPTRGTKKQPRQTQASHSVWSFYTWHKETTQANTGITLHTVFLHMAQRNNPGNPRHHTPYGLPNMAQRNNPGNPRHHTPYGLPNMAQRNNPGNPRHHTPYPVPCSPPLRLISTSEVTTLRHYTNLFVISIIIIITHLSRKIM